MTAPDLALAGYPEPRRARRAIIVLSLLGFFLSMDLTLTALLIEPMKRDMLLSDVQIGLLQGTAFGLAFGLSSIPMGRLIDHRNRVRLLIVGLAIWVAALAGTAFATNVATLMVCRVALGLVCALLIPGAASIIADLYPPERRSVATSLFAVGQATGQAFGILAGGLVFDTLTRLLVTHGSLLDGLEPWRALYLAAAAIGAALILLMLTMSEPARQEKREEVPLARAAVRELWRYRGFVGPLLIAMLFSQITLQAAIVWSTPVLIRDHGLTPGQFAGWLSAVMLVGGILGALAGGQLGELGRRRGGRAGVLLPALVAALATIPLSFFALAPSVTVFAIMFGLNLFAGAAVATIGIVAITLNIPNEIRGLAMGANVFVSAVFGAATAPAAIAFLSKALGGEGMLAEAIAGVSAPAAIGAAIFFALAMRGAQRSNIDPSE